MTYPGQESPKDTAEDILKSGYSIDIYNYGGSEIAAFTASQNYHHQQVWKTKSQVTNVGTSMEKVLNGDTVFVDFLSSLIPNAKAVYSTEVGEKRVHIGKHPFFSFIQGWAYQPGGAFNQVFDESLLLFISYGFPQRWLDKAIIELEEFNRRKVNKTKYEPKTKGLTLENMQVRKKNKHIMF